MKTLKTLLSLVAVGLFSVVLSGCASSSLVGDANLTSHLGGKSEYKTFRERRIAWFSIKCELNPSGNSATAVRLTYVDPYNFRSVHLAGETCQFPDAELFVQASMDEYSVRASGPYSREAFDKYFNTVLAMTNPRDVL
jgi:hypothetical protein